MREICEDIKSHVPEVVTEWEWRVREQPWYSLPAEHRIDNLPDVIVGLVDASLCDPADEQSHRQKIEAAAKHGQHRREQGIPEHLILSEYHLLRQAIWYYLTRKFGHTNRTATALTRIDTAITLATNASMWGCHRAEIEALGKWEEGIERIVASSPFSGWPAAIDPGLSEPDPLDRLRDLADDVTRVLGHERGAHDRVGKDAARAGGYSEHRAGHHGERGSGHQRHHC